MTIGDIVLYWPERHPTIHSQPEGTAVLLEFDDDQYASLDGKPSRPRWLVLHNGETKWMKISQLMEMNDENRKPC